MYVRSTLTFSNCHLSAVDVEFAKFKVYNDRRQKTSLIMFRRWGAGLADRLEAYDDGAKVGTFSETTK